MASPIAFRKGHGTQNDFVVLPDADGTLELTDARVRALCDRHGGLGADGVLRVARTTAVADAPADVDRSLWFMDYRNADGSLAEMCGNGVRLFARHLVEAGLVERGEFTIGTRAGERGVVVHDDDTVTVQMGPARVGTSSSAAVSGTPYEGVAVDVGNPHLVCVLRSGLAGLDLVSAPEYDTTVFPHGVNIEFVQVLGPDAVRMRVHERGVGETRSCGTGTVAAVAAVLHGRGERTGAASVEVLGGQVRVTVTERGSTLTGPAVFVAEGELEPSWWESVR